MASVFLSHSWADKDFVRKLAERLTRHGVVVWLDEAELSVGDSLIEKISAGIEEMEYVAAVLSQHSVSSAWVQKELSLAMAKEIRGRRVTVLPIVIEPDVVPPFLSDKFYADFTNPATFETDVLRLLKALHVDPKDEAPVVTLEEFEDLRIVGADKSRTHRPKPKRSLFHVYFELSDYAPEAWTTLFEAVHRPARDLKWRRAWVEGRFLVVACPLEEVPMHLRFLREDVATTNGLYRQILIETQLRRLRKDDLLDSLEFD